MKIHKTTLFPWLGVIFAGFSLGYSIQRNVILVGLLAVCLLFYCENKLVQYSLRIYASALYLSLQALFISSIWWFTKISASGWNQVIWKFSPQQWLAIILFIASVFVACLALIPRILFKLYYKKIPQGFSLILIWCCTFLASEILLSTGMSIISRGNGVPIMPSWNFSSLALLVPGGLIGTMLPATFGFWGSSFVVAAVCATITRTLSETAWRTKLFVQKNRRLYAQLSATLIVIVLVCLMANGVSAKVGTMPPEKVNVIAISANASSNQYLGAVLREVKNTDKTIIVLPEYSGVLDPFPAGILSNRNKDYSDDLKKHATRATYIVGTEDQFVDGKRHVISYALDNTLEIKRSRQKNFLVPGGEYVTPWIQKFISSFDQKSVDQFAEQRGRYVLKNAKTISSQNKDIREIGLGACSTILTPYAYRQEVQQGSRVLTSSVSYEQFKNTPVYERYAQRFAIFNARALKTPLVLSAYNGSALIIDAHGSIIEKTNDGIIRTSVQKRTEKSTYALLGDFVIVGLLFTGSGLYVLIRRRRRT